jgi:hypothetical protein
LAVDIDDELTGILHESTAVEGLLLEWPADEVLEFTVVLFLDLVEVRIVGGTLGD